jgi:hypothetical protein
VVGSVGLDAPPDWERTTTVARTVVWWHSVVWCKGQNTALWLVEDSVFCMCLVCISGLWFSQANHIAVFHTIHQTTEFRQTTVRATVVTPPNPPTVHLSPVICPDWQSLLNCPWIFAQPQTLKPLNPLALAQFMLPSTYCALSFDPENSAQPSTRTINPKPWTPEPWTLIPEP